MTKTNAPRPAAKRQPTLYKIKSSRNPVALAKELNLPYYKNTPAANALIQIAPSPPGIQKVWHAVIEAGLFPYNARKSKKNPKVAKSDYAKIRSELFKKLKNKNVSVRTVSKLASKVNRGKLTMNEAIQRA